MYLQDPTFGPSHVEPIKRKLIEVKHRTSWICRYLRECYFISCQALDKLACVDSCSEQKIVAHFESYLDQKSNGRKNRKNRIPLGHSTLERPRIHSNSNAKESHLNNTENADIYCLVSIVAIFSLTHLRDVLQRTVIPHFAE